jgi:hypothetical protein
MTLWAFVIALLIVVLALWYENRQLKAELKKARERQARIINQAYNIVLE